MANEPTAAQDFGATFDFGTNGHIIATCPAIGCACVGLLTMAAFTHIVTSKPAGTDKMKDLAAKIHKGAVDFLITEYKDGLHGGNPIEGEALLHYARHRMPACAPLAD